MKTSERSRPELRDGLADLPLVAVRRGGVDMAVADASAASTAARVSSGGVWNTPNPRAGIATPLFNVRKSTTQP